MNSAKHDPFGDTLRSTGPRASGNPWRFSTKYTDQESGWLYYGYRYYAPRLGRWVSRDPIGEEGGLNLLGLFGNAALLTTDPLGLSVCTVTFGTTWDPSPALGDDLSGYCHSELSGVEKWQFQPSGCPKGTLRIAQYAPQCRITISFRPGGNPDTPVRKGKRTSTTREHELLHASYVNHMFAWYTESVESWVGPCVCRPCAEAFVAYMNALGTYLSTEQQYRSHRLDCDDYPVKDPRRKGHCDEAARLHSRLAPEYRSASEAQEALRHACGQ